jgi:hypothetical protein
MINILNLSPWPLGGATSFVVNLAKTFEAAGVEYRVVRPAMRTEKNKRQMGEYGVFYQNMAWPDVNRLDGVPLLAAAPTDETFAVLASRYVLLNDGKFVFHDPNEFSLYPHWKFAGTKENTICIRETGLAHMPKGEFIPHPYVRVCKDAPLKKRPRHAVSVARISAVKKSDWIIGVNQTLPEKLRVEMVGEVNRFWWKFNVQKRFPGLEPPTNAGFARRHGEAARICMPFNYMVDLTVFKDDGGGSQYALLEAMDAGAVPVMTKEWCRWPGPARDFGFQVSDESHLKKFLIMSAGGKGELSAKTQAFRQANYTYLDRVHNPISVAAAYTKALGIT